MTHGDYAVRAFGRLEVHGPRGAVQLGGPRPRTVFALLLVEAGQPVSTDRLVDETWGASPPSGARRTLQAYIANLRRALGSDDGPLQSANSGYVVDANRIDVDLRRFEDLAHQGRALAVSDASAASDVLRRALDLWIDEPFADLPADDVPTLAVERVRLSELRLDVIEQRVAAELAAGHHSRLVPELEKLVAKHPAREGLWARLMVAPHESGRSAEALGAARRLRHHLTTELGLDPGDEVRTLEARIAAGERLVHARGRIVCPYKGLATLEPDDAELFFGRDQLTDQLVARLAERRLVAVVGASGTGKSSVVRGLIPTLRRGVIPGTPWQITIVTPSTHRSKPLAEADGMEARHLLVVDQLEEAFTVYTDAAERDTFLTRLADLAEGRTPAWVVIVVRADFYGDVGAHHRLRALVSDGTVLVGPMSPAEFEQSVTGPAAQVGLTVEPQLLDALHEDAVGEAGVLPLASMHWWRPGHAETARP